MKLTVTSWNINSVRLRIGMVGAFLDQHAPDILCLQETKTPDEQFPAKAFHELGYVHQAFIGQKGSALATLEREVVGIRPGLTLLLDVGVDEGRQRARGRDLVPDRIERERDEFFERVRAAYLARAAAEPRRIRVLDAARPPDAVAADAVALLREWMREAA